MGGCGFWVCYIGMGLGWDAFRWIYKGGVLGLVWFGLVYRIGGFVVVVVILPF